MRKRLITTAAVVMMTLAPMSASAAFRGFVGVGRPYYGYYGGWYSPYWGPYWGPAYNGYYSNAGEVKLETKVKDARVFINGAYAGTTKENKTMRLRPGNYNIEIRGAGGTRFAEKVYVVAGKTLRLYPEL